MRRCLLSSLTTSFDMVKNSKLSYLENASMVLVQASYKLSVHAGLAYKLCISTALLRASQANMSQWQPTLLMAYMGELRSTQT